MLVHYHLKAILETYGQTKNACMNLLLPHMLPSPMWIWFGIDDAYS